MCARRSSKLLLSVPCHSYGPSFALDVLTQPPLFVTRGLKINGVLSKLDLVALDPADALAQMQARDSSAYNLWLGRLPKG